MNGRFKEGIYLLPSPFGHPGLLFRVARSEGGHWLACPINAAGQPNACGGPLRKSEWMAMEPQPELGHLLKRD